MKLPHADRAEVDPGKLGGYLLSESHPVGKAKARFFREAGFDESTIELRVQGLLQIARTQEVVGTSTTVHGRRTSSRASWRPRRGDASGCARSGSLIQGRNGRGS
jgi:hypothetical protein